MLSCRRLWGLTQLVKVRGGVSESCCLGNHPRTSSTVFYGSKLWKGPDEPIPRFMHDSQGPECKGLWARLWDIMVAQWWESPIKLKGRVTDQNHTTNN